MFAGLLTAAKMAASGGSAIADLAEKAGTSVEAISSLGYAAAGNDVPIEELASGIKKMQVNITDAAKGGKQGQEALAGIGVTADQLGRLLPEEQFRRIADRIARYKTRPSGQPRPSRSSAATAPNSCPC